MVPKGDSITVGKRLSYDGALCTVRYVGPVDGTKGEWLGVEWDDPTRGKHAGEHQGKVYFKCLSRSQTAASFVRPTRLAEKPRSFLEALRYKYAPVESVQIEGDQPIKISGKVAEEVGFDKIRKQLSALQELKIVILDDLRIGGMRQSTDGTSVKQVQAEITETCPKIQELHISRSLLEDWDDVADICRPLKHLRILKISGNRLRPVQDRQLFSKDTPFSTLQELYIDETLMRWDETNNLVREDSFPNLKVLSAAANDLQSISTTTPSIHSKVTSIFLNGNHIPSLERILPIFECYPGLQTLSLQGNRIMSVQDSGHRPNSPFSRSLRTLNISGNEIDKWPFLDDLSFALPNITSVRLSKNPLYTTSTAASTEPPVGGSLAKSVEETAFMLTLARIGSLKTLNFSTITDQDRLNGELYFLSSVERDISARLDQGQKIASLNISTIYPRYHELCQSYDREPLDEANTGRLEQLKSRERAEKEIVPGSLAARLVKFNFRLDQSTIPMAKANSNSSRSSELKPSDKTRLMIDLPASLSTYSVKGLLSRKFSLPPLGFRLIYESAEFDPVAETLAGGHVYGDDEEDCGVEWDIDPAPMTTSDSNNVSTDQVQSQVMAEEDASVQDKGKKWRKREVEMLDSTRDIGSWLDDDAKQATVRIELSSR